MWKYVTDGNRRVWTVVEPDRNFPLDLPSLRGIGTNVIEGVGNLPDKLPFSELERSEPIRPRTIEADIGVHFLRSVISGIFVALGAAVLVMVTYDWSESQEVISWKWIPISFALIVCLEWFRGQAGNDKFLMKVERITGLDVNRDGHVGTPSTVRVEVTEQKETGGRVKYVDFPVKDIVLQEFLTGLLEYGLPLSRPTWVGEGKLLTRGKYEAILDILITEKWAYMVKPGSPTAGYALTVAGKHILRQTLENMK